MTSTTDLRTLISELNLLTRAQVQIINITKNKAKDKPESELVESDYVDTIQMRFLGGGRIPLSSLENADRDFERIVEDIREIYKPLQVFLLNSIKDASLKKDRDINDIEMMGKVAKWVEDSEGDFCQIIKPNEEEEESDEDYEEGEAFIEFLESWSLYYPRERKEEVEDALNRIQGIIDSHTLPQRDLLSKSIVELTGVCAE